MPRIEVIPTALTNNYVAYWNSFSAIKEAAQNIAYGALKSGRKPRMKWENGRGILADSYTGFEKRHLYLGESEQRSDTENGIGNFGEGWKLFMLVMAREGKFHRVNTVGFSFYGKMEPSPHGVDVLNIYVEPNQKSVGTEVVCECNEADFFRAVKSFATLAGIDEEYVKQETVLPGRHHELWINGVKIEKQDNSNPLNLYYAYNIRNRELMNRDRSQVDTYQALSTISELVYKQDERFITQFVKNALDVEMLKFSDINRGMTTMWGGSGFQKELWRKVIAKAHHCRWEQLCIGSDYSSVNREAEYRKYKICKLPGTWRSALTDLGMAYAEDVIKKKTKPEKIRLDPAHSKQLGKIKNMIKKAYGLGSVSELPKTVIVEDISDIDGSSDADGMYDHGTKTVYLCYRLFSQPRLLFKTYIHEIIHWRTGCGDFSEGFIEGWENLVADLMGVR